MTGKKFTFKSLDGLPKQEKFVATRHGEALRKIKKHIAG